MEATLEKLQHQLIVLPGTPVELQCLNPAVNFILGACKTVRKLFYMNLSGLVVCAPVPLKSAETRENSDHINTEKISQGFMFIPAPNFDKVVIVKNVIDISEDDSISILSRSILDEIDHLNNVVCHLNEKMNFCQDKLSVRLFLCYNSKVKKSPHFPNLESTLFSKISETDYVNLEITVQFLGKKDLKKRILRTVNETKDVIPRAQKIVQSLPNNLAQGLIFHCFETIPLNDLYHLSRQQVKLLSKEPETFDQVDKVIQLFDFYFPARREKLQTVPYFDQVEGEMVYKHNVEGKIDTSSEYYCQFGEMRLLFEKMSAKFRSPRGILLKSFSNDHLRRILDFQHLTPQQFEIDGLYLGCDCIIAFEVCEPDATERPGHAICNKIIKVIEKILPQMQLILYSFYVSYQHSRSQQVESSFNFLEKSLKIIVYLPYVTYDKFESEIEMIRYELQFPTTTNKQLPPEVLANLKMIFELMRKKQHLLNLLQFLIEDSDNRNELKLVQLSKDFQVLDSELYIGDIFNDSCSEENSMINYFHSLFCFARLSDTEKVNDACFQLRVSEVNSLCNSFGLGHNEASEEVTVAKTFSNLVLSPQQHRILSERDKTHLLIRGQPGSGKTTLILAKCEQMASSMEFTKIYFLYDKRKLLFQKYLEKIKYSSNVPKGKIEFTGIYQFQLPRFLYNLNKVVNLQTGKLSSFCLIPSMVFN